MSVSFKGAGELVVTFYNNQEKPVKEGDPVKLTANGEITPAASGERFMGVALKVNGDYAACRINGFCEMPFTGAAPKIGYGSLAADGQGGVKTVTTAAGTGEVLILTVDSADKSVGFIL